MDQQKIGAFLKELRKEKNITQEELAEKMLVSRRTVSRWETGTNMPDMDILMDISEQTEFTRSITGKGFVCTIRGTRN